MESQIKISIGEKEKTEFLMNEKAREFEQMIQKLVDKESRRNEEIKDFKSEIKRGKQEIEVFVHFFEY